MLKDVIEKALKQACKRELVTHLITTFGLSIRQACQSLNLSRTAYHYRPDTTRDEPVINGAIYIAYLLCITLNIKLMLRVFGCDIVFFEA
ncbi:hypothetical protein EUB43_005198 [Escherichia coli]|nr:hypothetical protein [Escherichia coli]EHK9823047.1 hypothetical protein [Escherichia coli]EIA4620657.1 hypothetical protein [Escherichia coli]EIG1642140.1 hypothetical protein [Escherichia coli]EIG5943390.1 hypothetical protein [Escherichia coli]